LAYSSPKRVKLATHEGASSFRVILEVHETGAEWERVGALGHMAGLIPSFKQEKSGTATEQPDDHKRHLTADGACRIFSK
jgi:hypothetical protein